NDLFFGLASHSYPNPGFSGLPDMTGRGTIRTYEWELDLLKSFGVKELPVFITETGWKRQGILDENVVAQYYKSAFENVWLKDRRVRAVTPFVFDYQSNPFLGFSWKLPQAKVGLENEFYPQYYAVQAEEKVKGMPEQVEKGEMLIDFPHELLVNSSYHFRLKLKNLGQSIWDKDEGYVLKIAGTSNDEQKYFFSDLKNVRPFETSDIDFYFKTDDKSADNKLIINLYKGDKKILADREWDFKTLPLPSLSFTASLYPKLSTVGDDFEIQIFDDKETLVFDKKQTSVAGGKGLVKEIQNIALGRRYRVVLLKKYYLPRQEYIVFRQKGNQIKFKRMYPFDFNTDGRFDLQDLSAFIKNPALINLFFL
ncbi:MAG: hypothetical protein M1409_01615, partial [Actinobacteria bacterium]|nr:hypothetical protein [Actinomycetota bacterium]